MEIRPTIRKLRRKSYEEESKVSANVFLDCSLGYNSFGTSGKVVAFAKEYDWSHLRFAPDTSYKSLKTAICRFWSDYADLEVENVKIANGSAVLLSRFNKLFIERGAKVLGYVPQFTEYQREVEVLGGNYCAVPLNSNDRFRFNVNEFLSKVKMDHSIIYIDNPNNPTGQLIDLRAIETIVREAAKKKITVLLDEAYGDYVEQEFSAVKLIPEYNNLVVTRTFTKGYGIGQFRVGYGIFPKELGEYYDRIDLPFSVSTMGAALAREALLDRSFVLNLRGHVKSEKDKLTRELTKRGYVISETCPTCPLFIIKHKKMHSNLRDYFLSKGIMTTSGADWQNLGDSYVRINTPANADCFLSRLENPY